MGNEEERAYRGPATLVSLSQRSETDLRTVQVKFTFVGPQKRPIPSVVITTFYHFPDMGWFLPIRTPGLHYANDDIAVWHFAITPKEMQRTIALLAHLGTAETFNNITPHLSLMTVQQVSRFEPMAIEVVLDRERAHAILEALIKIFDHSNSVAHIVMRLHQKLVSGAESVNGPMPDDAP